MFKKFLLIVLLILSVSCLHAQTRAYVTSMDNGNVAVIDVATNTQVALISTGGPFAGTMGVVLTPDGTRAYVCNFFGNNTSVIDTATNTVVATIPEQLPSYPAITPDGKRLYVPSELVNIGIEVIDTATNSIVATIPVGSFAVVISPDGSRAYAASSNSVLVIDTATNTVIQTIGVTSTAGFFGFPVLAISPNGANLYVAGGAEASGVSVIDTASNAVVAHVSTSAPVFSVAVSPDGSRVYFPNLPSSLGVIDTATNTVEPTFIPVPVVPAVVAVTPDGAFVYVTNFVGSSVAAVDTATNTAVANVPVGGTTPVGIAIANLSTPFSNLTITGLSVNKNGFTESGNFTLGPNSSGLNLAAQPVTLTVDGFSFTIPAGSFKQVGGNMHFVFNGLTVSMNLMANGTAKQLQVLDHGDRNGFDRRAQSGNRGPADRRKQRHDYGAVLNRNFRVCDR